MHFQTERVSITAEQPVSAAQRLDFKRVYNEGATASAMLMSVYPPSIVE
jgi:hypothetical protein